MRVDTTTASSHTTDHVEVNNHTEKKTDALMVHETDEDTAPTSPRNVHGLRWALVCISIYVSLMTYGLDMTIAADVQATIIVQFDSVDRLAWVGSGFLLGSVCSIFPV